MPVAAVNSPVHFNTLSKKRAKLSPAVTIPEPTPHRDQHEHSLIYNRRLPAHQLCSDVLEYIFLLAVAERGQTAHTLCRAIISYSHICHDWRFIVLSVKRLWSRLVDFEDASCEWNTEMLRRSHPLPIRVSYYAALSPRNTQALKLQIDCLDRIRSYTLGCPDTDWDLLVALLDTRSAPMLEKLSITCHRSIGAIGFRPAVLPSSLFAGGRAPKLRRLELIECGIDFRAPFLRSLRSLQVMDLSYDNAPTALEWLDLLLGMPHLAELSLQGAISPSRLQYHDGNSGRNISGAMPVITNLNLEASLSDVALLVDNLFTPPNCHWTLTCSDCMPGSSLDIIIGSFSNFVDGSAHSVFDHPRHLSIAAQASNIFLNSEPTHLEPPSIDNAEVRFYINLRARAHTMWEALFPAVAHGLGHAIPLITSLELQLPSVHPSLLPLLHRATSLDTLMKLSGKVSKILLPELQSLTPSGGVPLSSLRSIVFTDDALVWGESYRNFLSFLRWRTQMGSPIQRVCFLRCFVLEAVVKELTSLGVSVEGDLEGLRWQNL